MLLRTAKLEDKPALYALWAQAFGDSKDTIDAFFCLCYAPENTLVAETDGQVRAVLYLLENQLQTGENIYRAAYIYAAATEQSYRKNGLMSALLQYAAETAAQRQIDFLFLTPAEDGLFRYYGKRGFQPAFAKQVVRVSRDDLQNAAGAPMHTGNSACDEQTARQTALQGIPHIVWSDAVLQFDRVLRKTYGVQSVCLPQGFSVFETDADTAETTEFCFANGHFSALAYAFLQHTEAEQFTLCLPCFAALPPQFSAETVNTAMLRPISARAKAATVQNAYLGITLG
ncbi:MAG: GNAT family N-acetyltransferase [Clostridia bacterium]|nr:GNAT family N-acetyltransferase [Clostridia bacterium]